MREYMSNRGRLGWLIAPILRRVEVYRLGQKVEVLESPSSLSGEDIFKGICVGFR